MTEQYLPNNATLHNVYNSIPNPQMLCCWPLESQLQNCLEEPLRAQKKFYLVNDITEFKTSLLEEEEERDWNLTKIL